LREPILANRNSPDCKELEDAIMTLCTKSMICCAALAICSSAANLHAQARSGNGDESCFAIQVRLNGKPVAGPKTVTFKTKENGKEASLEGGCFRVPPAFLKEKTVDVVFQVARNRVYLSNIAPGFFAGPWDIELEDRRFGRDVVLPKHTRAKEACTVIFHVGEPESAMTQAPCRTPL
jgi:hypothetical protein